MLLKAFLGKYANQKVTNQLRLLLISPLLLISHTADAESDYVGSRVCASCHQAEYQEWRTSHHFDAMAEASADTVLGDFDNAVVRYDGRETVFTKRNEKYFVRTEGRSGEVEEFQVSFTLGVYPLQQYLIEFPDGRIQALSIAWDSRPAKEGGQRWYHLYSGEGIDHRNILHWSGVFQNWNSGCAACHVTGFQKNYSRAQDRYDTAWSEINVACEACHGKGSEHVIRFSGNRDATERDTAYGRHVVDNGSWRKDDSGKTARRMIEERADGQIETCAACHSRREAIGYGEPGDPFLEYYVPALLEEPLYFADGQVKDEVYVYGSFLQSKMFAEGVSCTNCHNPHNLKLKVAGNGLCAQCHQPAAYDTREHHHHNASSEGAQCIGCHMPETIYMGVDGRRDHSFRIPDPVASKVTGSPDACLQCHNDRDHKWSARTIKRWHGKDGPVYTHAESLDRARMGDSSVVGRLLELARDGTSPAIVRATAMLESRRFPTQETLESAAKALASDEALLRLAAVRSLEYLPAQQRFQLLEGLVQDPVKAVRIVVARALAGVPLQRLRKEDQNRLEALFQEFIEAKELNADRPQTQIDLGLFYLARGDHGKSEDAFRHALKLSPAFAPAMLNLADLYRIQKREAKAEELLRSAVSVAPDMAAAHHALGLLLVRKGNMPSALISLERAASLEPSDSQYAYVYSIALYDTGDRAGAIEVLKEAIALHPGNQRLREALTYFLNKG